MCEPSDRELIQRTRQGDTSAYAALVRRYQGLVYSCAYRVLNDEPDAEEVAQDTFVRFHRYLAQFDEDRDLRRYLAAIAVNLARDRWKRNRRLAFTSLEAESAPALAAEGPEPGAALVSAELRAQLHAALERLSARQRDVCRLFYLAGMTCQEVACALEMNENAVKVALHRARRQLFLLLRPAIGREILP